MPLSLSFCFTGKRRIRRPTVTSVSSSINESQTEDEEKEKVPAKSREPVARPTSLKKSNSRSSAAAKKQQAQDRSDQALAPSSSNRFRLRNKVRGGAAAAALTAGGVGSAVAASSKKSTKLDKDSDGYKVIYSLMALFCFRSLYKNFLWLSFDLEPYSIFLLCHFCVRTLQKIIF